ncbi:long-chain acyl-CoA synthetase [Thermonema lapsum]|uniref:Long-chain-fatty-acid--CoA ligase n=1 Tax=Thermonema lapsum TaxID=28195 RepID=A0A846MN73_9BACT|nr:AMP-binding protein [Thermonema lapsum]NIK72996.1 long-chain acyl-CoA synthetase [Thermonema lapsum]
MKSDYPWFKSYPAGVPHEINPEQYSSLVDMLEESFRKFSDLPAYEFMGCVMSYREVEEKSKHFAAYLQSLGLKKGDKFGIQMPNVMQYPVALFGALRAGLTVVNVNPLYTEREMEHQYNDAEVKAVIILANFADKLAHILPKTQIKHVIVTEIGDMLGFKRFLVNFVVKYVKKMVPKYNIPGAVGFLDALSKGEKAQYVRPEINNQELAFLQYTGGTTGVSKGAMLTHRNMVANLLMIKAWMLGLEEGKEIAITPLPLYHVFALTVNCFLMFNVGAKNVLIANPRDIPGFIKELKKHKFTTMTGLNTLFNALLNHPEFKEVDFSRAKYVVAGGMATQRPVAERWKEVTGTTIAEGYGLSETSPVLSCNPLDGTARIGTIGLPMPSTEMKIVKEDGTEAVIDEPGEIWARGPQVMKGYWNRPDETAKVMTEDGWFKTGDIGAMDADGFFRIVDRKKDMILVSGFNVYPNEVEEVVAGHPKVLEVAAIGVPDPQSTERVKLFVVKKDPSLTEEELMAYCKENLAGYKLPKYIEFRDELPKSNVGKILRRKLKEEEMKKTEASA